jgi:hypothetical protein
MDVPSNNGSHPSEPQDGYINKRAVYVTIGTCVGAAIFVHLVFLATDIVNGDRGFITAGWQPLVGIALSVVSLIAFGGFYLASRRFRVAITASFLLTFLIMMSFGLTLPEFAKATESDFMHQIEHNFFNVVVAVVGFYFGSESVVSIAKAVTVMKAPDSAHEITRCDRDLAETSGPQGLKTAGV